MPSGDMRRPPQIWEQRLAGRVSAVSLGVDSVAQASVRSDDSASTSYTEPEDAVYSAGTPSTPTVTPTFKGIAIKWDGKDTDGDLYNGTSQWVQVHVSASTGFTPSASTLVGHLYEPGTWIVTPLTPGTTYYAKLVGIDEQGTTTSASAQASGQSAKIDGATDIVANSITTNLLTAGTITGWYISGGTISGGLVSGGTVSGGYVTGGTVSGALISGGTVSATDIRTATSGRRVSLAPQTFAQGITFENLSTSDKYEVGIDISNNLAINGTGKKLVTTDCELQVLGQDLTVGGYVYANTVRPTANLIVFQGYRETTTAADVMLRLTSNVTTSAQSKFEVAANGDVSSRTNSYAGYSDARFKENITAARDYLDDLRDVDVVTFNWIGSDKKLLGVTAQQIQPIFPSMVTEDEEGTLGVRYSVFVPMLITAIQSLAAKVDDLTARIEALEG